MSSLDYLFERFSSLFELVLCEFGQESDESFFGSFWGLEDIVDNLLGKFVILFEECFFLDGLSEFTFANVLKFFDVLLIGMWDKNHEAFSIVFSLLEIKGVGESVDGIFDYEKSGLFDSIFIETEDELDGDEFFKEVKKDEMLFGQWLIISLIDKIDKRLIESDHEGFLLIDKGFEVGDSEGLKMSTRGGVKGEELFGDWALVGEYEANDVGVVGEHGDKMD